MAQDPLKFRDGRKYAERLKTAKAETDLDDAVLIAEGPLEGQEVVAAVQDFRFMAGSLGMAAGEAVVTGMLRAVDKGVPFILFAASGGARMQEGILSLMQMPRTTIAVQKLREARLPYLVVLTDPTTGGVTASYAMLGDVHIAEPGALICFAGPRVIQQTIREQLPEGFQKAEYLLSHGMIDMVVHRHKLRETLGRLCRLMTAERRCRARRKTVATGRSAAISTAAPSTAAPSKHWPGLQTSSIPSRSPKRPLRNAPGRQARRVPRRRAQLTAVLRSKRRSRSAPRPTAARSGATRHHSTVLRVTMRTSDDILAECKTLHPRLIDLSLGRIERLLAKLGNPQRAAAARDPCGRHQRQGLVHGLPEGDAGGRRQAGAHLHLAASRTLPRAHRAGRRRRPGARRSARANWSSGCCKSQRINAGEPITYFEITTAAAFLAFAEHPADAVILEVGLGGRLDATNVVARPALSVIMPVSMDHTDKLGERWRRSRARRPASSSPAFPPSSPPSRPKRSM